MTNKRQLCDLFLISLPYHLQTHAKFYSSTLFASGVVTPRCKTNLKTGTQEDTK